MNIGSVQFFKRVILCCLALMIIIPTGLAIALGIENHKLSEELALLKGKIPQTETGETKEPEAVSSIISVVSEPSRAETKLNRILALREKAAGSPAYSLAYQDLYPDLYIEHDWVFNKEVSNAVYLTFDDGPSEVTAKVLDMLRLYGIKATFFVVYDDSTEAADLLRRMVDEGHTVGVHSTTHQYRQIYGSVESFLTDFEKTAVWIEEETGVKPEIFRFPGGSVNTYNLPISEMLISEMLRRGYLYFDWNVSSGDASGSIGSNEIVSNVISGVARREGEKAIVLMHDGPGKETVKNALPHIIESLEASGREMFPLDNRVEPICFDY